MFGSLALPGLPTWIQLIVTAEAGRIANENVAHKSMSEAMLRFISGLPKLS